jgi:hypothetical protein
MLGSVIPRTPENVCCANQRITRFINVRDWPLIQMLHKQKSCGVQLT